MSKKSSRGMVRRPEATAGESVTLVLEDEVDASRGDVIASASHPVECADQFEADLFWMSEHALLPGRSYAALIHTKTANVTITHIKHRLDINTGAHLAAKTARLKRNRNRQREFRPVRAVCSVCREQEIGCVHCHRQTDQRDRRCRL